MCNIAIEYKFELNTKSFRNDLDWPFPSLIHLSRFQTIAAKLIVETTYTIMYKH